MGLWIGVKDTNSTEEVRERLFEEVNRLCVLETEKFLILSMGYSVPTRIGS